ncbi:MAG: Maf family protein [Bacteroidota bacterium]
MNPLDRPLILASKSPRRSQLLQQAGFNFRVQSKEVAEDYPDDMPPEEVPVYLAQLKANACRSFLRENEILLSADSVVILDQQIFEKPKDKADAQRILRALSGKIHKVITGVCLLNDKHQTTFAGTSSVHFEPLSEAEIDYYIDTYQPYDKAGAYAIQEWIGLCKISRIEGTYANIMGLPVNLVYEELSRFPGA